jgi:hypothetical protein
MTTIRSRMLGLAVAAIVTFAAANPAQAAFVNGGFETGDFTGWTTSSGTLANVVTTAPGFSVPDWNPTEGTYFAYLQAGGGTGVYTLLSQTFAALAGDVLSFDIFFDAADYIPFNDNGYANLIDADTSTVVATLYYQDVASVGDFGADGWTSVSHVIAADGNYKLEFGVTNIGDNNLSSALGVDNVALNAEMNVIPAPAGAVLFGLGLLSMGGARLIRRKQVA